MKDFLLVFRMDSTAAQPATAGNEQNNMQPWMDWFNGIAAKDMLVSPGNRLGTTGKVVKPGNVITDGPYTEIKESIGGYSIVKANSYEDAAEIAKGCPILKAGGNVEIREIMPM